jgi:adenylate cyclase
MDTRPQHRRLVAILSADAEGYSRLMGDDEAATVRTITEYRALISARVVNHGGRVVDAPGDNLLAEFTSVVDAVRCAVEVQRELRARNATLPEARRMPFRIGINLGDVIVDDGRLYGDGVNIAARLEGLAEGGDICLSGTAYDQVEGKLPLAYDRLGEHTVKNIARPVRVYRVRLDPDTAPTRTLRTRPARQRRWPIAIGVLVVLALLGAGGWAGWRWLMAPTSSGRALPDKPSIAVLPFANVSQDPAQEYFSDGVTGDLITGLSKLSGLFVIARNSAFTYKGKAVKVSDVGRDLGVRYVLEGSVQRIADRVRITAQLVDATTGYHIWAERYDQEVRDIFALQDAVTQQIVRALAVKLTEAERARLGRTVAADPVIYDLVIRGQEERYRTTREGNLESRRLFVKALDLDPGYARAYVGLSWVHLQSFQFGWNTDPLTLERARELAERGLVLDSTLHQAHSVLAQIHLWKREHDRAIAEAERAVTLAPNDADGYETLAEVLAWAGRPEDSLRSIEQAMRLNPQVPFFYRWTLGHAYYLMRRNEKAIDELKKVAQENPNFLAAHAYLAVLYTEQGRGQEAREAWEKARQLMPDASPSTIRQQLPYRRAADVDRVIAAMHNTRL